MAFSFFYPSTPYSLATPFIVDISLSLIGSIPASTSFTISPALQAGLSIVSSTGTIRGQTNFGSISTPINFTVTATASSTIIGTTPITISVNYIPVFNYPDPFYILKNGTAVTITPTYLFSNPVNIIYTATPDLASAITGLQLNSTNGIISGTPTQLADTAIYTIDANNNGVHYETTIAIGVQNAPTITYPQASYNLIQNTQVNILPVQTAQPLNGIYELTLCALPFGLAFNIYTGEISGSPSILTAARTYRITVTNNIGVASTALILNVQREFLAPPVHSPNFASNTFLTDPAIAMRRKAEILKYKKNGSSITQRQNFSAIVQGRGTTFKRIWNPLACPNPGLLCAPTSSSDVPGPVMNLCYNPNVPLIGYIQPNPKKIDIGFKWPQRS